jgi:hypothetical protein
MERRGLLLVFTAPRKTSGGNDMTRLLAAAAILAVTVPAFAQTTFYVVQDTKTKRCSIVQERPTTTTMVIVGDSGKVYTTEAEAQSAMRTIKVCEVR